MTFRWGKKSSSKLSLLTPNLQKLAHKVLDYNIIDCLVDDSYRTAEEQDRLYSIGKSKVQWPNSQHNKLPSKAMDLVPVINGIASWNHYHCSVLAGLVLAAAIELGIKLRWGGNWDMDHEPITDQDFQDLAHYEELDV